MIRTKICLVLAVTVLIACNSADEWQDSVSIAEKSKVQTEFIEVPSGYYGYTSWQNGDLSAYNFGWELGSLEMSY